MAVYPPLPGSRVDRKRMKDTIGGIYWDVAEFSRKNNGKLDDVGRSLGANGDGPTTNKLKRVKAAKERSYTYRKRRTH